MLLSDRYRNEHKLILAAFSSFMAAVIPTEDEFNAGEYQDKQEFDNYDHFVCAAYVLYVLKELLGKNYEKLPEGKDIEEYKLDLIQGMRTVSWLDTLALGESSFSVEIRIVIAYIDCAFKVCMDIGKYSSGFDRGYYFKCLVVFANRCQKFFTDENIVEDFFFVFGKLFHLFGRTPDEHTDDDDKTWLDSYEKRFRFCVLIALGEMGVFHGKKYTEVKKMRILSKVVKKYIKKSLVKNDDFGLFYERESLFEGLVMVYLNEAMRWRGLYPYVRENNLYDWLYYFIDMCMFSEIGNQDFREEKVEHPEVLIHFKKKEVEVEEPPMEESVVVKSKVVLNLKESDKEKIEEILKN